MNAFAERVICFCASAVVALGCVSCVQGADFGIASWTIDDGGGRSASQRFVIHGSIGQADADPLQPSVSADGKYSAVGGFWTPPSDATISPHIFRNGFED